jgi:hypothetical protein
MLPPVIVFAKKQSRVIFFELLYSSRLGQISVFLAINNLLMIFYGGNDSPRMIVWGFPFYMYISVLAVTVLRSQRHTTYKREMYFLVFAGLVSMRPLVPVGPEVFFPENLKYCSVYGFKTDYQEEKFEGLNFFKKFKLPTQVVPISDLLVLNQPFRIINNPSWVGLRAEVANTKEECLETNRSFYGHVYKYEVNNLPIPLGYLHNQYEFSVDLPFYGNWKVQFIYLSQWLLVLGIFYKINFRRNSSAKI